jgi:hypothetical protein
VSFNWDMSILIASIGPTDPLWILTACAVILSAVLALGALIPAVIGHLRSAVLVAAPAIIAGVLTTLLLVFFHFRSSDGTHGGFVRVWALVAGIPLAVSVSAILLAWFRSCKKESLVK